MALFKSIFGKKNEDDDGQQEYFKEDFPPVVKQASKKKAEPKAVEQKKAAPKRAADESKAKSTDAKKPKVEAGTQKPKADEPKKAAPKKTAATKSVKAEAAKPAASKTKKDGERSAAKPQKKDEAKKPAEPKKAVKTKELTDNSPEVKGAVAIKEGSATANGKWDIRRAKDGRFFFSLYASNHTVIAYSQIYSSTSAVMTGINSVIANAPKCDIEDTTLKKVVSLPCPKWEIYLDKAGEYRFRLYAPNGLVICHASHGYSTKGGCKGVIESIKRFSAEARVDKSYLK